MSFNKKLIIISLLLSVVMIFGAVFDEQVAKVWQKTENRLKVFAQVEIPYYITPRFPERLGFLVSELTIAGQELDYLASTLSSEMSKCNCSNASSECFDCKPGRVLGDPCPQRRLIERDQFDLEIKTDQVVFLRRLLEKEMEISLERELETLREDDALKLKDSLNAVLEESENVIQNSNEVTRLSNTKKQCQAQCGLAGGKFSGKACVGLVGQQAPMIAKFSVGISVGDLPLAI